MRKRRDIHFENEGKKRITAPMESDSQAWKKIDECAKRRGLVLSKDCEDKIGTGKRFRSLNGLDRLNEENEEST